MEIQIYKALGEGRGVVGHYNRNRNISKHPNKVILKDPAGSEPLRGLHECMMRRETVAVMTAGLNPVRLLLQDNSWLSG